MFYCKTCGKQLVDTAIICPECGTPTDINRQFSTPLKVGGWISSFFLPVAGVIIGIVALTKKEYGHGIGMITTSFLMTFFWLGMMASI
jgi:uncharacterized OB-fold protein